jgi:hypothetical protein
MWFSNRRVVQRPGRVLRTACVALGLGLMHCAFTEYGTRINNEQLALTKLEERRQKIETRYIIVLNNLEKNPAEPELLTEKEKVYRRWQALNEEIAEKRRMLDQSLLEWDQKIIEERIQLQMIQKEEVEAQGREPPPE